ncbi:MAG: ribonuclease Z [Deltaproteobacteria bacterium]|nr:ribonuclease Z [Deltaproteobacteria bacterium]
MVESFVPRLVNGPFEDPVLYIGFRYKRRAMLFDLGKIDWLGLSEIHKISDVFISHTHIDHFIGFDHLLRCSLNREEDLRIYGPKGIIQNVQGKLAGYTWNLIQGYPLKIVVREIDAGQQTAVRFSAVKKFDSEPVAIGDFSGVLLDEPSFAVETRILDHSISCLGFALKEKNRLNVRRERLEAMELKSGPWLDQLKKMLRERAPETTRLECFTKNGASLNLTLREWRENLILETRGQKIAYVVDCVFSDANIEQILALAREADLFFCEAAFSKEDQARATERYHLTAQQAAELARMAQVKKLIPFHFSLRYEAEPNRLFQEAMEAFSQTPPSRTVGRIP